MSRRDTISLWTFVLIFLVGEIATVVWSAKYPAAKDNFDILAAVFVWPLYALARFIYWLMP